LRWQQTRNGNLIKQRLEKMMVVPVYQRDAHRRIGKSARGFEPCKTGADNDDMGDFGFIH
jgi:ribosomal protein S17